MEQKKKIFIIDGNIGSGKTTLLNKLEKQKYKVHKEPIKIWKDYLTLFNKDKKRWGYLLQTKIQNSYRKLYKQVNNFDIVERSHESGFHMFCKNLKSNNYITNLEYLTLKEISESIISPNLVYIFLDTKPGLCYKRLKSRNRKCESNITIDYIKSLDNHMNQYKYNYLKSKNYFTIDGDQTPDKIYKDALNILNYNILQSD